MDRGRDREIDRERGKSLQISISKSIEVWEKIVTDITKKQLFMQIQKISSAWTAQRNDLQTN